MLNSMRFNKKMNNNTMTRSESSTPKRKRNEFNPNNKTLIMIECEKEDNESMIQLILHDEDINAHDDNGMTALMYAVENNNLGAVKILIKNDANVNAVDNDKMTALMYAVKNDNFEIVKFLLGSGADVDDANINEKTSLMFAVKNNSIAMVNLLIYNFSEAVNIDACDVLNRSSLIQASLLNNSNIVNILCNGKANVELVDQYGMTALQYAVKQQNLENVKILLNFNTSNLVLNNKEIAFMFANEKGYLDIIKIFLSGNHINVDTRDDSQKTALMFAAAQGDENIVNLLLEYKADETLCDLDEKTALMYASENAHLEIVKIFLKRLDYTAGVTDLVYAIKNNYL